MGEFNLDSFGEIIDRFLMDNEVQMLLTLPKGTVDVQVQDNTGLGSVVQFYILLNAIKSISNTMCRDMGIDGSSPEWGHVADELLRLVKTEMVGGAGQ